MATCTSISCLGLVLLVASPMPSQFAAARRPTDVTLVMSTSGGKYDGTYQASQVSRVCGELSAEQTMGERMFTVGFPDSGDLDVGDVTFYSTKLVGGVTTTTTFYLSVSVKSDKIGHPSSYVLDTTHPDNTGTATLSVTAETARLKVTGVNDRGETIDATVVCKPKS